MRKSDKPLVRDSLLLVAGGDPDVSSPVPVGTARWHEWLAENESFVFEGSAGHLTARREIRRGISYWYAYRRRGGVLAKTYLGRPHELTQARLEQASAHLASQSPLAPLSDGAEPANTGAALRTGQDAEPADADLSYLPMTEVTPPALPQKLIAWPRLTQRISTPVTIICAPSGFGKSTVLNEWRQSCGMPVAWAALTADDNRPLRFWSKVVTALRIVDPSLGQSWFSELRASSASALSRIVVNLSNDILRHAPNASHGIGLVLDNYHHIQNTEIHTSLQTWLEHIPQTLKLVIASNTRPPLALGYLKAKGMVVELEADDLRFTRDEGIEFLLQQTPGQQLAYSDMQTLVIRTEGWITGLVLAMGASTQQEDCAGFMETFNGAHPLLRDYFAESALHGQSWDVHAFLLKTSILKRLTVPLCDAVTGQTDSAEMLALLLRKNLFLEQSEGSDAYRYHGLFAETLRLQLQEQFADESPRLHRRAAEWYREHSHPIAAIDHLLAGKSWEEAAGLIEYVALDELALRGEDSRLLRWLRQLPEAVLRQHKKLLAAYLRLASIASPWTRVETLLVRLETALTSRPAEENAAAVEETLTEIRQMRGLWLRNDQETLELPSGPDDNAAWRMLTDIAECYRYYRRDLLQADARASAVYETAKRSRHLYAFLVAGGGCACLALSQGHLRRSEHIASEVLRQASELSARTPESASIALAALSNVYFMRNQLAQACQLRRAPAR